MRIAFYAPMKSPTHGVPSGDRRVASLLMRALALAGHRVELASTFRSYDGEGDAARQASLRAHGTALAQRMAAQWRDGPAEARPDLWFTYHVYYKAPDWLGPEVSDALGVPYVVAEASHAGKRSGGAWDLGHRAAQDAIRRADLLLCPTRHDARGLGVAGAAPDRIQALPPFLDAAPYRAAAARRGEMRARLAQAHGIDTQVPWIAVAAMMRPGDKAASYRALAQALARVLDKPWRLLVAGDGPARSEITAIMDAAIPGRAIYFGALGEEGVASLYAASDLCAWPAVNEAYGMAMLEAQAAGLPVISCNTRGVPDVVLHGQTGLLAPLGDEQAFAENVRRLLCDDAERGRLSAAAAIFAGEQRSLESAGREIGALLGRFAALARARQAT